MAFEPTLIREDFPNLSVSVHGRPLVYLDNAAMALKPRPVIDAVRRFYESGTSNVHRGVHHLSERATALFEEAREKVRRFLNAARPSEIVFTRGTTDAINLVAQSYGDTFLKAGDEILVTGMEHHSNIVPWQLLCERKGCRLRAAPIDDRGELDMEAFRRLLGDRTRFVSVVYASNSLGTVNPVGEIIRLAHERGAPVLIDAAQAVSHLPVDVQALGCDFLAFSGHKIYGPTGIGVLYGRASLLNRMPPYQGGGDMIASVSFERTTYNVLPYKFEAGTPHVAGVLGLGAAIDYVGGFDLEEVVRYEADLLAYATEALSVVPGLRIIGTARRKVPVISFLMDGIHAHDVGTLVDEDGIAIRTGHHCTQPVMARYGVPATSRASMAFYNTREEIDRLVVALGRVREVFA